MTEAVIRESEEEGEAANKFLGQVRGSFPEVIQ